MFFVAPARERGLKFPGQIMFWRYKGRSREGAWIEICWLHAAARFGAVAPARERGLKVAAAVLKQIALQSLPRGSVD